MIDQKRLTQITSSWNPCTKCQISQFARHKVHYRIAGKADTMDILFIGEGPGVVEDMKGLPFTGDSGKMLDNVIKDSIDTDTYLAGDYCFGFANLVACRPCDAKGGSNRVPSFQEMNNCRPHLAELISALDPAIVVFLGRVPQANAPLALVAANFGGPAFHLPHPSYILRKGGVGSPDYELYVTKLSEVVTFAFELLDKEK